MYYHVLQDMVLTFCKARKCNRTARCFHGLDFYMITDVAFADKRIPTKGMLRGIKWGHYGGQEG